MDDLADLNVDVVDLSGDHGNDYLWRINPHRTTKLPRIVYLTPEKLECSDNLTDLMKDLYWDQLIARFVIDEVHCVDTHGDFRPSVRFPFSTLLELILIYHSSSVSKAIYLA